MPSSIRLTYHSILYLLSPLVRLRGIEGQGKQANKQNKTFIDSTRSLGPKIPALGVE